MVMKKDKSYLLYTFPDFHLQTSTLKKISANLNGEGWLNDIEYLDNQMVYVYTYYIRGGHIKIYLKKYSLEDTLEISAYVDDYVLYSHKEPKPLDFYEYGLKHMKIIEKNLNRIQAHRGFLSTHAQSFIQGALSK